MKYLFFLFLFTLNVNIFSQNNYSDCDKAYPICKRDIYYFKKINGHGGQKELLFSNCNNLTLVETNSIWLKFKIKSDGILTFLITPFDETNDIDFILYKVDDINHYCKYKSDIRCMASGINMGSHEEESRCLGVTGLDTRSLDKIELNGCKFSDDNFLKFLDAKKNEMYVLFINNYDSNNGFSILFDGTTEFKQLSDCKEDKNKLSMQILNVFPVPSHDIINLSILNRNQNQSVDIKILNLEGKNVNSIKKEIPHGKHILSFDVSNIPSGNYFIKIENKNIQLINKFIKE